MGSVGRQQKQREGAAGRSGGSAAPFLLKTHEMVEDRETDEVLSWGEKGDSFVVWKPVEFARDLLPFHFKHNNFSSFVRQLNTYGFHKVVPNKWEFANDYFRRGEPTLLSAIRRRKGRPSPAPPLQASILSNRQPHLPSASHSTGVHSSSSASSPPTPHLQHLSSENEKLRRDNRILSNELENAKRHCDELLSFLSKQAGIRHLDVCNLMRCAGIKGGEEAESGEVEDEAEKSRSCLKLFGVFLNESPGNGRRTKNRRCDGSAGRITKVGESWAGVSSPVG